MNLTITKAKTAKHQGGLPDSLMNTVIDILEDVFTHLGKKKIPPVILTHDHCDYKITLPHRAYNSQILIPGRSQALMNLPRKKKKTVLRHK